MNLYQVHGLMQAIVFLILYPLGALTALFRNYIGPKWRPIHIGIQLTATFLFIIAISLALYLGFNRIPSKDKDTTIQKLHRALGRTIAGIIALQIFWAYYGRNYVDWMTWYYIHMTLSSLIILGGFTNIYIARKMLKK